MLFITSESSNQEQPHEMTFILLFLPLLSISRWLNITDVSSMFIMSQDASRFNFRAWKFSGVHAPRSPCSQCVSHAVLSIPPPSEATFHCLCWSGIIKTEIQKQSPYGHRKCILCMHECLPLTMGSSVKWWHKIGAHRVNLLVNIQCSLTNKHCSMGASKQLTVQYILYSYIWCNL